MTINTITVSSSLPGGRTRCNCCSSVDCPTFQMQSQFFSPYGQNCCFVVCKELWNRVNWGLEQLAIYVVCDNSANSLTPLGYFLIRFIFIPSRSRADWQAPAVPASTPPSLTQSQVLNISGSHAATIAKIMGVEIANSIHQRRWPRRDIACRQETNDESKKYPLISQAQTWADVLHIFSFKEAERGSFAQWIHPPDSHLSKWTSLFMLLGVLHLSYSRFPSVWLYLGGEHATGGATRVCVKNSLFCWSKHRKPHLVTDSISYKKKSLSDDSYTSFYGLLK